MLAVDRAMQIIGTLDKVHVVCTFIARNFIVVLGLKRLVLHLCGGVLEALLL